MDKITLRSEVRKFAELMERVLQANDYKGGWKRIDEDGHLEIVDPVMLMRRLREEVEELAAEVIKPKCGCRSDCEHLTFWSPNAVRVGREAADVANFALMVADVCGALAEAEAEEETPAGPVMEKGEG